MAEEKNEPPKMAEGKTESAVTSGSGAATNPGARPQPPTPGPVGDPAKPVAPARPAAPPKPPVKPEPWSSPLLDELLKRFAGAITEPVTFRNQPSVNIVPEQLVAICEFLKSPDGGAYTLLTDETAVDFPKRAKRFDIIYHLYSFAGNNRLRLRVQVGAEERVPSVTGVWPTANWLEREIFDMFGVRFDGHPDLKRLLMPDEWVGHPLRKDYDILRQDRDWVRANLGIDSAQ